MENIRSEIKQDKQKKYRNAQSKKGLVRYELQIKSESKTIIEDLVRDAADEYIEPYSERQRMAKARVQVFDEITNNIKHEFFALKDQIKALKGEIAAISPSFFKADLTDQAPIPEAIRALPNDPEQLKPLLAKFYRQLRQAIASGQEHKQKSDRFEQYYTIHRDEIDRLKQKLSKHEVVLED